MLRAPRATAGWASQFRSRVGTVGRDGTMTTGAGLGADPGRAMTGSLPRGGDQGGGAVTGRPLRVAVGAGAGLGAQAGLGAGLGAGPGARS